MRITNNMLVNNMMGYMANNLNRMDKYQRQLATGKKIDVPSDDPVVAARALKLRTDVSEIEQYKKNALDAHSWMDITETALGNIGDILHTALERANNASTGTVSQADALAIRDEVSQLRQQLIHIANSTYAGRYIFSGFQTDKKLIDETTGDFAISVNNTDSVRYEIGIGDDININVPGGDLFNNPAANAVTGTTPTMITHFDNFLNALLDISTPANKTAISNSLTDLTNDMDNVLRVRSDIGARMNRLELSMNRIDQDYLNFTKLMSENEDVDEAETIMNLKNEENVYRASLAGGARIIQPSLIDFLR